ncbi:MAG: NAD+ synthase [Acidimicrobiia bacterium]
MHRIRVALAQINTVVGDLDGNVARTIAAIDQAEQAGADLVAFPELTLTGYPPEDLVLKPGFVADNRNALAKVAARTARTAAIVGFVDAGRDLHNAAAVCAHGEVQGVYRKRHLPNYAVFDEERYFVPGSEPLRLFEIGGVAVGVSICEDAWSPNGPIADLAAGGAELVVNINASPFFAGRQADREKMLATRAADASCGLVYVNLVGGQDELVFDGGSMVFDAAGRLQARFEQFAERIAVVDLDVQPVFRKRILDPRGRATATALPVVPVSGPLPMEGRPAIDAPSIAALLEEPAEIYEALVTGTRDYVRKNGFSDVVIGLSGGVDSSLVAAIAVAALGPEHVHGVSMPSRYSSDHSKSDAFDLAANLGVDIQTVAIEPAFGALLDMLAPAFTGREPDLTEENIQSRIRGLVLMSLNNKFNWLVLTTGNKSEVAVGYFTLYGDSAGGFGVIKDVPKTMVYRVCEHINARAGREVIPVSVLTKPPSAELRPDQRDDQSLPPYDVLDPLLEAYVEHDLTAGELVAAGFDAATVARITALVDRAEFKRRQSPPGPRVTAKGFGKDRRLPITSRYRG